MHIHQSGESFFVVVVVVFFFLSVHKTALVTHILRLWMGSCVVQMKQENERARHA